MGKDVITVNTKEPLVIPEVPLSPLEVSIAERFALGDSVTKIADRFDMSSSLVTRILRDSNVKSYVQELVEAINQDTAIESKRIISRMVRDKIESAAKDDVSLGDTTRKDIPDLLRILQDIEKGNKDNGDESPYIAIIQQMSKS
jgi:DNA-binding CsgD family transcriptional regulator